MPTATEAEASKAVAELAGDLPTSEMIVFLRSKAPEEPGFWRVVNSRGLWTSTDRASLDTPLAELPPDVDRLYEQEPDGVDSVSELAER